MKEFIYGRRFKVAAVAMAAAMGGGFMLLPADSADIGKAEAVSALAETPKEAEAPLVPIEYPAEVKALYVTASMVRSGKIDDITALVASASGEYGPNAIIIDVQDGRGKTVIDDKLRTVVRRLRFLRILPIARVVVFQNDSLAEDHPEWAVKMADGGLWKDTGGRYWVDPASEAARAHVAGVAEEAIKAGFGEINFDYFRFPSEGIKSAVYPFWREGEGKAKRDVVADVARFMKSALGTKYPDVRLTVDIFGYTFMRKADLGIGQSAPDLAGILDAVYPMIYPSHFDAGNFNFDNPAAHPYEVMLGTLEKGKEIFAAEGRPFENIRPWLQDFNMGADYTPEMVRVQMKAVRDAGLSAGWLIWNPSNRYRKEIFVP